MEAFARGTKYFDNYIQQDSLEIHQGIDCVTSRASEQARKEMDRNVSGENFSF